MTVTVKPVVTGILGAVHNGWKKLEEMEIRGRI